MNKVQERSICWPDIELRRFPHKACHLCVYMLFVLNPWGSHPNPVETCLLTFTPVSVSCTLITRRQLPALDRIYLELLWHYRYTQFLDHCTIIFVSLSVKFAWWPLLVVLFLFSGFFRCGFIYIKHTLIQQSWNETFISRFFLHNFISVHNYEQFSAVPVICL